MTDASFMLAVLQDGRPHSTVEIIQTSFKERGCGLTPHSRCSDLRAQGHDITCKRVGFKQGRPVWSYQLVDALRETTETESPLLGSSPVVSQSALSEREHSGEVASAKTRPSLSESASSDPSAGDALSEPEQLVLGLPGSVYRKEAA